MRAIAAGALAFMSLLWSVGPVLIVTATASRTPQSVHVKSETVTEASRIQIDIPSREFDSETSPVMPAAALHGDPAPEVGLPARWRVPRSDLKLRSELSIPLLLARAESHLGKNPTGWGSLWCAHFICRYVATELCRKVPNPNLARSWAQLPKAKPAPGVIVVLTRGRNPRAGHIGIVKRVLKSGDLVVISGNTYWKGKRRTVGVNVYSKRRVIAYVSA